MQAGWVQGSYTAISAIRMFLKSASSPIYIWGLELVLLHVGDGYNILHHGLIELVLRHKLKLDLLDPVLESA